MSWSETVRLQTDDVQVTTFFCPLDYPLWRHTWSKLVYQWCDWEPWTRARCCLCWIAGCMIHHGSWQSELISQPVSNYTCKVASEETFKLLSCRIRWTLVNVFFHMSGIKWYVCVRVRVSTRVMSKSMWYVQVWVTSTSSQVALK